MFSEKPIIIINFKKLTGEKAVELANRLCEIPDNICNSYDIILAIQPKDLSLFSFLKKFKIVLQDTFASKDHDLDYFFEEGNAERENVFGVLLNHPEKKMNNNLVKEYVVKSKKNGIHVLICSTTVDEAVELNKYNPEFIGIESEKLIGKSDSFQFHCPEIVKEARSKINNNILIGAGIKTTNDLKQVLKDGGAGVLISSVILNSEDPKRALELFLS